MQNTFLERIIRNTSYSNVRRLYPLMGIQKAVPANFSFSSIRTAAEKKKKKKFWNQANLIGIRFLNEWMNE